MEGINLKCPKCQFNNRDGVIFCEECGGKLEVECPSCKTNIPLGRKFCGKCGAVLTLETDSNLETERGIKAGPSRHTEPPTTKVSPIEGERKHVTVLFSDMSGYTAMSERLDPEDVKEITGSLFEQVADIINRYEGFIEKFIGDAVMAIFGATRAYEDDPIRAIKAAIEIHALVKSISPQYEKRIGQPLSMHTGINTGLVVTGELNLEKGTHGLAGDTINLAARLGSLADKGHILVGPATYFQAEGYFDFEILKPSKIKGKANPVNIYRVISRKIQPRKIHRLQGVRARLIGRRVEMNQLAGALERLKNGQGSTSAVYGNAGTGKSRIIEEFKSTLDLKKIHWIEGYAYPYTQNIPYYPLINLIGKAFKINEADQPETVREKIETGISSLLGRDEEVIPYIGGLYSLSYPEADNVSPEFWKQRLQMAVQTLLTAIARRGPTVICLEDLHWADPSFLELIRLTMSNFRDPILFLCVYRPLITLFKSHEINGMINPYLEIEIKDLSSSESQDMIESLLNTENAPPEIYRFIQEKIEGNPFYLEELVNSLIESKALISDGKDWKIVRPITESEISSTIHGVISARLDRLEKETKRILQEASVIGRAFYFDILKKITELGADLDKCLGTLERLDLIKAKSLKPYMEYIFKHALTQDVVYSGLLKKERLRIHERIGLVMEQLFKDRLPEFYETLAFHFKQGQSVLKAVDYLMKSGDKSLKRYAVREAYEYYGEAYGLFIDKRIDMETNRDLFFDLINKWSLVYYYLGDFKEHTKLLKLHEPEADLVKNSDIRGMFYGWLGFNLQFRKELKDSYRYLQKALAIGKEAKDQKIMGYACCWLTWSCAVMDKYDEAYSYWEKAVEIAKGIKSDQYLFFKSMGGISQIAIFKGAKRYCFDIGSEIIRYGSLNSNIRSQVVGYICMGHSHYSDGNYEEALISYSKALEVSADPFYSQWSRLYVGIACFGAGKFQKAEEELTKVYSYVKDFGCEIMESAALSLLGAIFIIKGKMAQGLEMIERCYHIDREKEWGYSMASGAYTLAKVYAQLAQGKEKPRLSVIAENIAFIARNVPFAFKKSEAYFNEAIETAEKFDAKGIQGLAYYDLGNLYVDKKRKSHAKECLLKAIDIFKQLEAEVHLKNAEEALKSLQFI